jgi:hypothetical protein
MKNVTITLPDDLALRARVEAAKAGKSLSRWIGERVEASLRPETDQTRGLKALLALPLMPLSKNGRLPTREELYDRESVRRFERDDLRPRSKRARKARRRD